MQIERRYLSSFSRIFSPMVLDGIIQNNDSKYLRELLSLSGMSEQMDMSISLSKFFDGVYWYLFRNYRNEYVYKNAIANKILLGRHSLNTSNMLTEFRVNECKADVVIINGTMTVYEIKTELDSFSRLEKQIGTYFDFFEYVYVVTSASQVNRLCEILPAAAGILVLTDRNTIKTVRNAISNKENVKREVMFDSLRQPEYTRIIKEYFVKLPEVPNTMIFRECKKLFCEIPLDEALNLVKEVLKERRNDKVLKSFIHEVPDSLYAYGISLGEDRKKLESIIRSMSLSIDEVVNPKLN